MRTLWLPPVTGGASDAFSCLAPGSSFSQHQPSSLCALGDHEDLLHIRAQALGIAIIIGNVSFWQGGMSNDLFVCGAVDETVRYRKRYLTPADEAFFQPGADALCCQVDDWKIGLSICFDLRFPQHWRDLAQQNCDLFINAAHMAGPDEGDIKQEIIPSLYQTRAAEWVTPLLLCNTSADDKWLPSGAWMPAAAGCCNVPVAYLSANLASVIASATGTTNCEQRLCLTTSTTPKSSS